MIGISYYPLWHWTDYSLSALQLNSLNDKYNKKVLMAKISYPFTLEWNDWTTNLTGLESQPHGDFPATFEGQKQFTKIIKDFITGVKECLDFCYLGGGWVSLEGKRAMYCSKSENHAFWYFANHRLTVRDVHRNCK